MAAKKKAKRVSKPRVARTRGSGKFTEAGYYSWLRSQLRRISQRWPPLYQIINEGARKATEKDREQWGNRIQKVYDCEVCNGWFPRKMIESDHRIACGSLRCDEDIGPFVSRMLVEKEGLRRICRECHQRRTKQERQK